MSRNPRASVDGLEQIDLARIRQNWNKLDERWFNVKAADVAKKTLQRFWDQERLRKSNFVRICEVVGVDWTLVVEQEIITVEQANQLVEALIPICPDRQSLALCLQQECTVQLSDISQTKDKDKHESIIKAVVDWIGWIDSPTKLMELIIGAARHSPQHQGLQTFIYENLELVFTWSGWDFEPSTAVLTQRLWTIVLELHQPAVISEVLENTVGRDRLFVHLSEQDRNDLQWGEEVTGLNLYRLFDILLHRYPYSKDNQTPNLLIFAQKLRDRLEQHHGAKLQTWLHAFQDHCGYVTPTPPPEPAPTLSERSYEKAVLMICVEGKPSQSLPQQFRLMTYLQAYFTDDGILKPQQLSCFHSHPEQPYEHNALEVMEQVKNTVVTLIQDSLTKIRRLKPAQGRRVELQVEIFLPYNLLDWAIDLIEIDEITKNTLGVEYKLVSRSYAGRVTEGVRK
ncbi:MAG: hypothetical protein F6J87_22650 [Spirulina sp. SIO3F2]|nr:hypothetical protein [Spirulina sp. SIO3F2]